MLVGKINPTAKSTKQESPFDAPVVIEANYMTAMARPYQIGAKETNFEVVFGNIVGEGAEARLERLFNAQVKMTAEELEGWGTDDVAALEAIAAKLPTKVVSTMVLEGQHM
jgi:hypothetical protein